MMVEDVLPHCTNSLQAKFENVIRYDITTPVVQDGHLKLQSAKLLGIDIVCDVSPAFKGFLT